MHVELRNVALVGAGARADLKKMAGKALPSEDIKMSIAASLAFPRPGHVECMVNVESESDEEAAIRLKVTYQGSFTLSTEKELVEEDQREISAACTAKLFPYIREFIADLTRRLPLTSPIILHPSLGDEKTLLKQMANRENEPAPAEKEKVQ